MVQDGGWEIANQTLRNALHFHKNVAVSPSWGKYKTLLVFHFPTVDRKIFLFSEKKGEQANDKWQVTLDLGV